MGEGAELSGDDEPAGRAGGQRPQPTARDTRRVARRCARGEITGVYGFMGCGQIELARALFGKGRLDGRHAHARRQAGDASARPRRRARAGIALCRKAARMMLFRNEQVYKNISIAILGRIGRILLKPRREREIAARHIEDLQIRPPNADIALGNLSGGNQQKVALAKWLTHLPKVLILSEPTRGMDVGAKEDVIRIVRALRDQGVAVAGVVDRARDDPDARRPGHGAEAGRGRQRVRQRDASRRPICWLRPDRQPDRARWTRAERRRD